MNNFIPNMVLFPRLRSDPFWPFLHSLRSKVARYSTLYFSVEKKNIFSSHPHISIHIFICIQIYRNESIRSIVLKQCCPLLSDAFVIATACPISKLVNSFSPLVWDRESESWIEKKPITPIFKYWHKWRHEPSPLKWMFVLLNAAKLSKWIVSFGIKRMNVWMWYDTNLISLFIFNWMKMI